MLDLSLHDQSELRVFGGFRSDEFQKANLWNHQDIGKPRLEPGEVERAKGAVRELERRPGNFRVRNLVKLFREPDLIEYFENRRMNGVAAKFAIEILVHFKERYAYATTRQKQRQHGPGRAAADDAARRALIVRSRSWRNGR